MVRARIGLFAVALFLAWGAATDTRAASVTYNLDFGLLQSVQLKDSLGNVACVQCLTNPPIAITGASVTVDTMTNQVLDLRIESAGPGIVDTSGLAGYGIDTVTFTNAVFQSSLPVALTADGVDSYTFAVMPGLVSSNLLIDPTGPGLPIGPIPYANAAGPAGRITFAGGQIELALDGVLLGSFADPQLRNPFVDVKADFFFTASTAVVPEPDAAVLYGVGLLVAAMMVRQRSAVRSC